MKTFKKELTVTHEEHDRLGYLYLTEIAPGEVARTRQCGDFLNLDFDSEGRLLGIEVLDTEILPEGFLRNG